MWICGTDIGGTHTDVIGISDDGLVAIAKVPSTPPSFEQGIVDGLRATVMVEEGIRLLFHGTTIAANTVITQTGVKTGLITTKGFRDLLELRRANRGVLYDLMWDPPAPLVPRHDRLGVTERVDSAGNVLTPLDEDEARDAVRALKRRGVEAIAVCFLNCFANPENERRMKEIIGEEFPEAYLSVASEVLPQPPEFERTSTVVANAYVGPPASRYLSRVSEAAAGLGYTSEILVMHSGGGLLTADSASKVPIRLANSGPAAGVIAAAAIGRAIGRTNLISFDMGGTSSDIALIDDAKPRLRADFEVEWGVPVLFPSVDLVVIGAGGGSIAWLDPAGYPKSGPQSAGAIPGPACYGLGGVEPTNTDANVVLGRLSPETFLGGRMQIDRSLAEEAIRARIAEPTGLGVAEAAAGILEISNQNMAAALRRVTVQRGYDPREFSLIAFGGAGPLHCVELARDLEIPEVIVPPLPGVTSALGLLFADLVHDFSHGFAVPVEELDFELMEVLFREMEGAAVERLMSEGQAEDSIILTRLVDFRYHGQMRMITVPWGPEPLGPEPLAKAVERFHDDHKREFGYARPAFMVETGVLRVSAQVPTPKPDLGALRSVQQDGRLSGAPNGSRDVYFPGAGYVDTMVYKRSAVAAGTEISGPAVLEEMDSTVVLPPGSTAKVDDLLNIVIEV